MRLFALAGSDILGRTVADAIGAELDPVEEREFGDGEHKSRPLVSVRNEDVYVLHTLGGRVAHSPAERLVRLLFFVATCRENGAARVTAIAPYLAFSRKEQQTKPRDPINSRYVAQLFEAVGTDMMVTVEAHNPAAFQNAFRCGTTHLDATGLFVERLRSLAGSERIVFLSPDSGGMRRAHRLREAFETATGTATGTAIMEKHRSEGRVTGDLFAGEVAGATVVIIDDMIATGGTVLRAARAARARDATRVIALATHGLFAGPPDALLASGDIERIIVTDTVATPAVSDRSAGRLEVLGMGTLLGEAIQRLHSGGSIRRLLSPRP